MIFGSQKKVFSEETTITNNHIIARNKNFMTTNLLNSLQNSKIDYMYYDIIEKNKFQVSDRVTNFIYFKNLQLESLEYIYYDFFEKFIKAADVRTDKIKECESLMNAHYSYIEKSSEKIINYLYNNILNVLTNLTDSYNDKINEISQSFIYFYNKVHEKLEALEHEHSSIMIYNLIYNEFQSISSKSLKTIEILKKKLQEAYQKIKPKISSFKPIRDNKIKNIKNKAKSFIKELEEALHECEHCKSRKEIITNITEDLVYNKYIEKNFLLELDSDLGFNSRIFNLSQIDFGYSIENCLYYLYKEIEERKNVLEHDLYSKSKTREIEESLYYLFEKLNLDFFEYFKLNIDELYYNLKYIRKYMFQDLKYIKGRLSRYLPQIFEVINTTIEEASDDGALNSLKNKFKNLVEGYNETFFEEIDYIITFEYNMRTLDFNINHNDLGRT